MTGPDFSRGYLRVPLGVWLSVYCRAPLTRRQLQLVSVVIRESWGWQARGGGVRTWTRRLDVADFADATGLATDHLTRDLRGLVHQGVLEENGGRYQFVAHPQLWKTPAPVARKVRLSAQFSRPTTAVSALPPGALKTERKISNRNGSIQTESGSVDNSLLPVALPFEVARSSDAPSRFVAVVAGFVGSLSPRDAAALRQWCAAAGIAAVWRALEPAFRESPAAARRALTAHVTGWMPFVPLEEAATGTSE